MDPVFHKTFLSQLKARWPDPQPELHFSTPFEFLVAVMLSARATDRQVNRVTSALFAQGRTPKALSALSIEQLTDLLITLGLYRRKSLHLYKMIRQLIELHQSQVPRDLKSLKALAGVGQKTANLVLSECYGDPVIAVDTHVFRISNRTGLAPGRTPQAVEARLMALLPKQERAKFNYRLVLHGRYICRARAPKCNQCPVQGLCDWFAKVKETQETPASQPPKATPLG